ncbi:gp99 [Sphingomonas phage PAU]|uniref:gp99 n=1 Tax=Sphingomonas phage PAU TaxID=1150991 RepID=UPI0002573256|nr:gp99 [Sphingomonas phage PAU]AFF28097.1 gp99 [Sphingomonas phage PAU]
MAQKIKSIYHGLDLLKNELKNALVKAEASDPHEIVNLELLEKAFLYDTVKAISIKNVYSTVGGLTAGTDVSNKNLKEIFDLIFFNPSSADYVYPLIANGKVTVSNNNSVVSENTLGSPIVIEEFLDYEGDVKVKVEFDYLQNDGGDLSSILLNGNDFLNDAIVTGNKYTVEIPIKSIIGNVNNKAVSLSIGYDEGPQKNDESGQPSGTPIPSGSIVFYSIVTFNNLSYPAFYKVLELNEFIEATFNYQTDGTFINGDNYASVPSDKVLVIGIPVQGNYADKIVLKDNSNFTNKTIRREIGISSSNTTGIQYKLYYYFSNESGNDFTIGLGPDLSELALDDSYGWIGVQESLICLNQGVDNSARYSQAELTFGSKLSGYILQNTTQVPNTTSASCLIGSSDIVIKLADLSTNRFTTLNDLYLNVRDNVDASNQIGLGTEQVILNGDKVEDQNGNEFTNKGFSVFQTVNGYSVLEIKSDNTYDFHRFPGKSNLVYEWKVVPSSGTCQVLFGQATGRFLYQTLELYIDNIAQGEFKDNLASDQDYVEPLYTAQCLNIIQNLGKGLEDTNRKYTDKNSCDFSLSDDIAAIGTVPDVDYYVSGNNSLCYQLVNGVYSLAGKANTIYIMVKISGIYYKILQINPDSSWQYHYYTDNSIALVPTSWVGDVSTGVCVIGANGQPTGYLNFTEIYLVYSDTTFGTELPSSRKNNGQDGDTVPDVLSDLCKNNLQDVEDITYNDLIAKINNSILARNKRYRIIDYKTVSDWSDGVTSLTLESDQIEPLIVLATSVNTLAPIAYSESFPDDVIYYNVSNDSSSSLYYGCTTGHITKRIDTINNSEYDFDFRNMKTGVYMDVNGEYPNVISLDTLHKISNSKISLAISDYGHFSSSGAQCCFIDCVIDYSEVNLQGVPTIFDSVDNIVPTIRDSKLTVFRDIKLMNTYVNGKPTEIISDKRFPLSLYACDIYAENLFLGYNANLSITRLIGWVAKSLYLWRTPIDAPFFKNENIQNAFVTMSKGNSTIEPEPFSYTYTACIASYAKANNEGVIFNTETIL